MTMDVGVIGLGALGKPVAERLRSHGVNVAVYDVREEPMKVLAAVGATACDSPARVAERSDCLITLVSNQEQSEEVVASALTKLRKGTIVVIGSTLGPGAVRALAADITQHGGETLDAPISGGLLAARDGTLSLMIGGSEAALARARPVLEIIANKITRAGDVGAGQAAKLAHQLVFSLNVMSLLEGLALGSAAGVDPEILKTILREGIANSAVLGLWSDLGPRWKGMLEATTPGTTPPNMRKDLHLVLEMAQQLGVTLYLGTQGSLVADAGVATGRDNPIL